jgi:hypothetical protein
VVLVAEKGSLSFDEDLVKTAEEGMETSVEGEPALEEAVKKCWSSLFRNRVLERSVTLDGTHGTVEVKR